MVSTKIILKNHEKRVGFQYSGGRFTFVICMSVADYRFLEDVVRKADSASRDPASRKHDRAKIVSYHI